MSDSFSGVDFYATDALLAEEERMARDTVRAWVTEKVLPVIEGHHRAGTFPRDLIPDFARLNLLGANLQGYGCAGLNHVAYGLILQELERGDSGLRSFASVQGALVMYPILTFGSEAQKTRWLPRLASADAIGCFGLTEPDFGSNPAGMAARAVRRGDRWVLNGTKRWITSATLADVALVWAKDEAGVVQGFLVERGTKGLKQVEIQGKFSLRASDTGELILEDCEVPESARLPGTQGLKSALMCLNQARYGIAWGAVGAAMACYHTAVAYAKTRVQFGKPIGAFQITQEKLAFMLTEITKAQLLCLQLGRLKDAGKATAAQISLAKRNNVAIALDIARLARDLLGASGIVDDYPVIRHMLNLESVKTYEGTHDIHTLILGEAITGFASYQ